MTTRVRFTTLAALAAIASLGLVACGAEPGESPSDTSKSEDSASTATDSSTDTPEPETYEIAITQFLEHPSLDAITQGFKDALEEKGVKVNYSYESASGDQANTQTIAGQFAADPGLDLIVAVATPSAQAMVNAVTDRPVLFAGITDPVSAGLVPSWEASRTNVTGTSDLNPEGRPAALVVEIMGQGDVKTIGFPYSLGEKNSEVQLEALIAEATPLGITVKDAGIAASSELATGLESLTGVDAIFVGTDNAVVTGMEQVVAFCQEHQIPLFVADTASVARGAVASRGIDYYELGKRTGDMAYEILVNGVSPGAIPPLQVTDTQIVANPDAAASFGITIPASALEGAEIVTAE
ncbi:MAG: ABC transporter substrate-binding protein [Bifidobacteriaceae bacterium]|jgi:putative ABC transport system substrate-binding protein|nr:ABC transporter substrate-binding protein [Bifidobacteriaceae bacterium]